jgi:hypothetical protein
MRKEVSFCYSPLPSVCLHGYYFGVKKMFHHLLKFKEFFRNLIFEPEKINPGKFTEVVNKTNIVFLLIESGARPIHQRK